ncbi:unnamed protein product [Macrosiphum euphorbiae]|uniref:Uncharacterized protein n=1 Tax=Macrosiphum euphorbiae TaxID=13131 RepID=A0AAV0YB40_9HEMI|nr:unnamed protein product [Macrosiphum euphorbiae]
MSEDVLHEDATRGHQPKRHNANYHDDGDGDGDGVDEMSVATSGTHADRYYTTATAVDAGGGKWRTRDAGKAATSRERRLRRWRTHNVNKRGDKP